MRKIYLILLVLGMVALLAACGGGDDESAADAGGGGGDSGAAAAVDPATAGSITGQVMFEGTPPEPQVINMDAEPKCAEMYTEGPFSQNVVVNENGTLANVFVYVKSGLDGMTFPTPSERVVLDQVNCRYVPHVLGVQTNQPILIRNSDDLLHNVNPEPKNSRSFNVGQPKKDMETERSFPAAEVMIPVGCDVHGWMSAYIGVVDHPYFATTGENGSFELANLPPGEYVVEAWHEVYGSQEMTVTVGEKEAATVNFTFKGG